MSTINLPKVTCKDFSFYTIHPSNFDGKEVNISLYISCPSKSLIHWEIKDLKSFDKTTLKEFIGWLNSLRNKMKNHSPANQSSCDGLIKLCTRLYDYYYPSGWGKNPRGWKKKILCNSVNPNKWGYDSHVVVHFPERYESRVNVLKGLWQGKLIAEFTSESNGIECRNFVLHPSMQANFALADIGSNTCNYGIQESHVVAIEPIFEPDYNDERFNRVYTPRIVKVEPLDFSPLKDYLQL